MTDENKDNGLKELSYDTRPKQEDLLHNLRSVTGLTIAMGISDEDESELWTDATKTIWWAEQILMKEE